MVNAKLSLSFPKWEKEAQTRYFPYINRLVKFPHYPIWGYIMFLVDPHWHS